jgi:predicted enzyme related to lactoylglutathione lyase
MMTARLRGLRTATFVVPSLEDAKRFYTAAVGHPPYFDEPFYVGFDVEGYELGLLPAEGELAAGVGGGRVYFAVDDIEAASAQLSAQGARLTSEPHDVGGGIVLRDIDDPWGNAFGIIYNPSFCPQLVEASAADVSERRIEKVATVALSPGGSYEIYMLDDAPAGQRGADWCRVLSFLPGRMLSFTWNAPPQFPTTRPRLTGVVLTFDDATLDGGGAGCRVTLTHLGWPASGLNDADSEWPATFDYFDNAWTRVMQWFEEKWFEEKRVEEKA